MPSVLPHFVILSGELIVVNDEQRLNALLSVVVNLSFNFIVFNDFTSNMKCRYYYSL
nr:hypothetical protein [Brachyspira sp.]